MSIFAIFYCFAFIVGVFLAILKGPIWGLLLYVFVYFNIPNHQWWGSQVPDLRWSYLSAIIILVSCLLHKKQLRIIKLSETPGYMWLFLLLILMLVTVPMSYDPSFCITKIYDFAKYVIISWLVIIIISDEKKLKLYLYTFISQVFYLSYVSLSYFKGSRLDGVGLADAGAANEFSYLLASSIPLVAGIIIAGSFAEKVAGTLALGFILNAFSMCRSRGGFVSLVGICLWGLCISRRYKWTRSYIIIVVSIVILLYSSMDNQYIDRVVAIGDGPLDNASAGRTEIWSHGITMVKDYPLGMGGGGFMKMSPYYLPANLIEKNAGVRASHNTYLLILVEQGLLGLIVFLVYALTLLRTSFNVENRNKYGDGLAHVTEKAVSLSFAGMLCGSFFCDRFYYEGFYLIAAIIPICHFLRSEYNQYSGETNVA